MKPDFTMPVHHRIHRYELCDSAFHFTEESLVLAVGQGMIHPRPDVPDTMIFKESSKCIFNSLRVQG